MANMRTQVPTFVDDPAAYNEMINAHVTDITTNEARGAWRDYAKLVTEEHAIGVCDRIADPSYRGELVKLLGQQLSGTNTELQWAGGGVENFIKACLGYFGLPNPSNKEAAFFLLLKYFRTKREDLGETEEGKRKSGSDAMKLTENEALLMIDTMARILVRLYNLQEGTARVSAMVKKMMDDPLFARFLKNLNVDTPQLAASKLEERASNLSWVEPLFCQADVGKARKLSVETRQVHFFAAQVLNELCLSSSLLGDGDAAGEGPALFDDDMIERLIQGHVVGGIIDRVAVDDLVRTFLTLLAFALRS